MALPASEAQEPALAIVPQQDTRGRVLEGGVTVGGTRKAPGGFTVYKVLFKVGRNVAWSRF